MLGSLASKKVRNSRGSAETFVQFWWANSIELLCTVCVDVLGRVTLYFCVCLVSQICFTQEFNTCQNYRSKHTTSPETSIKRTCCSVLLLFVHCFKEKRRSLFLTVHLTTGHIKTMVWQSWNIWRTFQSA